MRRGCDTSDRSTAVPEPLLRHRTLIDDALRAEVGRLPCDCVTPVSYHLGWCDADGTEAEGYGGKAVRPAIALLAAEAAGAPPESALPGAVALQLVHEFSLIHDDIMDGDTVRRHRPTVWATWGIAHAVVVGDALLAHAQRSLLDDRVPNGSGAAAELARATATMIEGQCEDMSLARSDDTSIERTLAMSAHKTGALIACAGALGGLLGGAETDQIDALRSFGRELGIAFQAVDDVLGIWGDPERTGKPAANDLRERKKSLPVAHALASGARGRLSGALAGDPDDRSLTAALHALQTAGSREWTLELAHRHLDAALQTLDESRLSAAPADDLASVARFLVERDS